MKSSEHILKVISLIIIISMLGLLTVIWVYEWPQKRVYKYPELSHIFYWDDDVVINT